MGLQNIQLRNAKAQHHASDWCRFSRFRNSWRLLLPILSLTLITVALVGCLQQVELGTDDRNVDVAAVVPRTPTLPIGKSGLPTIEMTEREFEDWLESRRQLAELLPMLSRESRISRLPPREYPPYRSFFAVSLPGHEELFIPREAFVDLAEPSWREVLEGIHYFPEIARLYITWPEKGNPIYDPQEYEDSRVPVEVASATQKLPLLLSFACYGGRYSKEFTQLLAAHPAIRGVGLGRCRISPEAFAAFERLETLEELSVTVGASPDWFVTLAKLPRFRSFSISGKTLGEVDLNQPVDDAARQAIESLNGRLEVFYACEAYGTVVHADVARALFRVKTLRELCFSETNPRLSLADLDEALDMPNLVEVSIPGGTYNWGPDSKAAWEIISRVIKSANERRRAERQAAPPKEP